MFSNVSHECVTSKFLSNLLLHVWLDMSIDMGFLGGSMDKEPAYNAGNKGDRGSVP